MYERAVAILEELLKANPSTTQEQVWLVQGLKGLGATQLAVGRTPEAASTWRWAVAIGDRLGSEYGETLCCLACCHALLGGVARTPASALSAGEGPAELDRAMEILRRGRRGTVSRQRPDAARPGSGPATVAARLSALDHGPGDAR
jgi:hypothetical protein